MSDADRLKDRLLKSLLTLREQSRKSHVGLKITGEYNRILVVANDQLGVDMRGLAVTEGERSLAPFRHISDLVENRPFTPEEKNRCLMDGDTFRARLETVIKTLAAFVPPRDRIGFRP